MNDLKRIIPNTTFKWLAVALIGAAAAVVLDLRVSPATELPVTVAPSCRPRCLEDLARMPWPELECLYRNAAPGGIPVGFARGQSFQPPGSFLGKMRSQMSNSIWRGKQFSATGCDVVNQWRVGRAIRGEVFFGTSWLDGKPSIIIDYRRTSRVWSTARDELREVAPGLYVGVMHLENCPRPRFKTYFILESRCRTGF